MQSYFLVHNLDGIVDATKAPPLVPSELSNWLLRQKKAAGFIAMKLNASNWDLFLTSDNCRNPRALWQAIKLEYASKKARNRSRLFTRFLSLNFTNGNLSKYVSSFREITREMTNSGVTLDDDLIVDMALHHSPDEYSTTLHVIIATVKASDTALTLTGVLRRMHELIRDNDSTKNTATTLITHSKNHSNKSPSYKQCSNGQHNPVTSHTEDSCWQLHPSKSPHSNSCTLANVAKITGRALCTRVKLGAESEKSILDSGSSHHMFKDQSNFISHLSQETLIEVANGESMMGQGLGTVSGSHHGSPLSLSGALHVPDLKFNLVSLVKLAKKGCALTFKDDNRLEVSQDDKVALSGTIVNGLMELDLDLAKPTNSTPRSYLTVADGTLLHRRLGHPGQGPFSKAFPELDPSVHCDPCVMAKHHQLPYRGHFEVAGKRLELIHRDLSGSITPPSLGGSRYCFKITDSCGLYKFVYLLQYKSQTFQTFVHFKTLIKNQTSLKIKAMNNNNGGEYTSCLFHSFVKQHGIRMHLTAPYTPQQKPVAEVGNQTTTEKSRALLKQAGLPTVFWEEAVATAVYLENHTPVASRGYKTPYKLWHGHPPSYDHLSVFGCLAYVHVGRERRSGKFADTAKRGIFVGYQEGHHNYRVWLPE